MLEQAFQDVYTKFKLHFYQNVFQRFATREATLTTVESFCMEGIMAMGEPTIAEFSRMMQISTPDAANAIACHFYSSFRGLIFLGSLRYQHGRVQSSIPL